MNEQLRADNRNLTRQLWLMAVGAFGFGLSQLLFAYIVWSCARGGEKASAKVWDGANPQGLEWTVPSPAPHHTFDVPPIVK